MSALAAPADLGFPKPQVDALLIGELALAAPTTQVDVGIRIGSQIRKSVRVFGDRVWGPGAVRALALTRPRPFTRMPLVWERSFGGIDPDDPRCWEPRNPVGTGLRSSARALEGQRAPNFEDALRAIDRFEDRPAPAGFGPIAPHWQPRAGHAGTYGEPWLEDRFPLLPLDFDARFFNVAPLDQRLDAYRPGEDVLLSNLTPALRERFTLPALEVPITMHDDAGLHAAIARVDTLTIEPSVRTLSLVARASFRPEPDALAIHGVFAGELTRGRRRALDRGKMYVGSTLGGQRSGA
jgi:hypothetical protein